MEESITCDDSSGGDKQSTDMRFTVSNQTNEPNNNNNNNKPNDGNTDNTIDANDDSFSGRPHRSVAQSVPKLQRTFVQALYEMFPQRHGVRYVEEGRKGPPHNPLFQVSVHVNGQIFYGTARTKQSARHEAAKEAINYFTRYLRQSSTEIAAHNRRSYTNDGYHRYAPYYSPYRSQTYDYNHFSYSDIKRQFVSKEAEDEWRNDDFNSDWGRRDPRFDYNRDQWRRGGDYYSRRRVFDYPLPSDPSFSAPQQSSESPNASDNAVQTNSSTSEVVADEQSGKHDFTSDNYDHENFVEFKKNDGDKTDEENDDQEASNVDKMDTDPKFSGKKERIILRVMSETPVHQNPVSVIHELHPDSQWHFLGAEEDSRKTSLFQMRLQLPLANQSFSGSGRTKKLAKAAAASKALLQLYNISINPLNLNNPESYVPKSTVFIAQEPLFLNQDVSNKIGTEVMNKCTEIWNTLTEIKKWTVLASIVITDETNVDFIDVICITSGTKCVKGDSLSMNGLALNDCHAEVLARRCFLNYLYTQIEMIIANNFQDKPDFILERREDSYGFRVKKHFKVHLFISTAPCGDSRVFSPKEENESDAHPNRVTRGVLRAKIEGGEGTIPVKRDAILTWDGILQGHQRLQFMSCSDKIAVWNVVGLQGSLLSHILEPVYLESVILGSLFNYEHLVRALHGRLNLNFDSNSLKGLPETYYFNKAKVAKCQLKEDLTRQLTKTPSYAINWIKGDQTPEVISCDTGRVHKEGSVSRLSKRSLFARFCSLLGQNAPTLPSCALGNNIPVIYRDGKTASQDYQRAKTQVMNTFQEQNLGNWIQVPTEIDLFRL